MLNMNGLKPAPMGTVSEGTLRPEDLFTKFEETLEGLLLMNERTPKNMNEVDRLHNVLETAREDFYDEDGDLLVDKEGFEECVHEELAESLEAFAPPYCYFGVHEGDGADFGFWPSSDAIDCLDCFDAFEDLPDHDLEDVVVVNDHGNVTIYRPVVTWEVVAEFV